MDSTSGAGRFARRLALRLGVLALGVVGFLLFPSAKGCWEAATSTCAKVWTAQDLTALQGGKWERSSLFDSTTFCSATWSRPGVATNSAFLDLKRDVGGSEAERFLKDLTLVQKLPDADEAYVGVAERGLQTLVLKRPKGALRIQFDAAFTPEQVRKVPALLKERLPDVDRYLGG